MATRRVVMLNPRTCGIYKSGKPRYKTDPETGLRTGEIDNELIAAVNDYLKIKKSEARVSVATKETFSKKILVPTYYDIRYQKDFEELIRKMRCGSITLGELIESGIISMKGGHGSPSNDQRTGCIPYIKVSDIRGLRINVNPTNLVPITVAKRFWKGDTSGLEAWDLITPNRASSNIGEFAILLPGEQDIVLTKEVFVLRVLLREKEIDPFYLLWALSLNAVRQQWKRIALMQTNREDCGDRYREIVIPWFSRKSRAREVSEAFRVFFGKIATSREEFLNTLSKDIFIYNANVTAQNFAEFTCEQSSG